MTKGIQGSKVRGLEIETIHGEAISVLSPDAETAYV